MKTLKCRDVGFDCEAAVTAETVEEVFAQAAAHAQEVHGVAVTPEMAQRLRRRSKGRHGAVRSIEE